MNEDLLGECRACGQMISKNLTYHGCPKCGERSPHWTEEEENQKRIEWVEREQELRKQNRVYVGCLFVTILIVISIILWMASC